jgi:hypothetical protein
MRSLILPLALLLIFVTAGCDETDPLVEDEDFILAVMVLDDGGQPKAGMSVARLNRLEGITPVLSEPVFAAAPDAIGNSYPNPFYGSTTIEYSTSDTRVVLLEVFDWRERKVSTVLNGVARAGDYTAIWNGRSSTGIQAMNGVYTMKLTLTDTLDAPEYSWEGHTLSTLFDLTETYRHEGMGSTDATGFFSTQDLDYFPSLQGHGALDAYDAVGDHAGTFSFSDTLTIRVSTPPPAEGGWIYHMSRRVVLVNGPNYIEFYFVPDDSMGVFIN